MKKDKIKLTRKRKSSKIKKHYNKKIKWKKKDTNRTITL